MGDILKPSDFGIDVTAGNRCDITTLPDGKCYAVGAVNVISPNKELHNYKLLSIALLLGAPWFAIPALVAALRAEAARRRGEARAAAHHGNASFKLIMLGVVSTVLCLVGVCCCYSVAAAISRHRGNGCRDLGVSFINATTAAQDGGQSGMSTSHQMTDNAKEFMDMVRAKEAAQVALEAGLGNDP